MLDLRDIVAAESSRGNPTPRTKEAWLRYVTAAPAEAPILPHRSVHNSMSQSAREAFDMARIRYHSAMSLIRTRQYGAIEEAILSAMLLNRNAPAGATRGVVISAPGGSGKSTLALNVGRDHERRMRRLQPDTFDRPGEDERIPVAYISVPAGATPKDLTRLFAEFYALPLSGSTARTGSRNDLTSGILRTMERCQTELVFVDDMNLVNPTSKSGKLVHDHLKHFNNGAGVTWVFLGVDIERMGLFNEGMSASVRTQTAGRMSLQQLEDFRFQTAQERLEWAQLVLAFEDDLRLFDHEPGMLATGCPDYLFTRCQGRISTLSDLIRTTAMRAIIDGTERVTRQALEQVVVNHASQTEYERMRKPVKVRSRKTA